MIPDIWLMRSALAYRATGYIEGQNVAVEYRWAEGQYDRLPALAAELVRSRVAVLVTTGGEPSVMAAKAATSSIPIVFTTGGDPVKMGLVASLSRPGGNATGISLLTTAPEAKRLGILHELAPRAALSACLLIRTISKLRTKRGRYARRQRRSICKSRLHSPEKTKN